MSQPPNTPLVGLPRREFLRAASLASLGFAFEALAPAYARAASHGRAFAAHTAGSGRAANVSTELDLRIAALDFRLSPDFARPGNGLGINGSIPGPLVRLREGEDVTLRVHNGLDVDTSIHWHGLLVPADMDGVPGLSFDGIAPRESYTYRFRTRQSGTYWYHSHSGLQEQSGVYGPLVIEPAEPAAHDLVDRDHVVLLSDWTFEKPHRVLSNLKADPAHYNRQRQTLLDLPREISEGGWRSAFRDRFDWAAMRMDRTDLSDVTGVTYTYLCNGLAPDPARGWVGEFAPGDRVRLRLINGSAMTFFDVRIPGLRMTVVQADGQDVDPVVVDELRIGVAETYDVIVEPTEDRAYALFAESLDRSGYALGTLAPRAGARADVPRLRPRALRSMSDMGHGTPGVGHGMHGGAPMAPAMSPKSMPMAPSDAPPHAGHAEHQAHADHAADAAKAAQPDLSAHKAREGHAGHASPESAMAPVGSRLDEPGVGLGADGWRVLVYTDLRSTALYDVPAPTRELELHLTGNMERYMWSFDGVAYSEVEGPIHFEAGECLRLILVNDTMMEHPIHLHGMWMVLENGAGVRRPRKHTISIQPNARVSAVIDVDAPEGDWAFHCHLLYHMHAGMMRTVRVQRSHTSESGA